MMAIKDPKGLVTNEYLDDAVSSVLKGMDRMVNDFKGEMNIRFDKVDSKLDEVDVEVSSVKDNLKGLTADLADTVSKREFNNLRVKVDRFITS